MKIDRNKIVIIVNAYSRDKSLRNALNSIKESVGNAQIPLVVILQSGFPSVSGVIEEYLPLISDVKIVSGANRTPLENINYNRYLGYEIAFVTYSADWVMAIEEDVEISGDAYNFVKTMVDRFKNNPFFRGVNLGSREPFEEDLLNTYSLLRYGMHGQASVIGVKTWNYVQRRRIVDQFSSHGFDWLIEKHLKTGFMVTPNLSRSLDTGWDGTHMPGDSNDPYFAEIRSSFVGDIQTSKNYVRRDLHHRWRDDVEIYKVYKTPAFLFRTWWKRLKHASKVYLETAR